MTELPPELGKNFGILFYTLTYIVAKVFLYYRAQFCMLQEICYYLLIKYYQMLPVRATLSRILLYFVLLIYSSAILILLNVIYFRRIFQIMI